MALPTDNSTSKNHKRRPWKASFPYETDYNDHFETPDVAYEDVAVLLDWINSAKANGSTKSTTSGRSNLILYDPYYCQGRTAQLFRDLEFTSIIHDWNTQKMFDPIVFSLPRFSKLGFGLTSLPLKKINYARKNN